MTGPNEDIVASIKARVAPESFDLSRAEGRRDFDNALRYELRKVRDESLRAHAAELLKVWRWSLFGLPDPYAIRALEERVAALEVFLGLTPRDRRGQTEIKTLNPRGSKQ